MSPRGYMAAMTIDVLLQDITSAGDPKSLSSITPRQSVCTGVLMGGGGGGRRVVAPLKFKSGLFLIRYQWFAMLLKWHDFPGFSLPFFCKLYFCLPPPPPSVCSLHHWVSVVILSRRLYTSSTFFPAICFCRVTMVSWSWLHPINIPGLTWSYFIMLIHFM